MSEDIRQFQTKDERAGDELRRILGLGMIQHVDVLPLEKEMWEYLDKVAEDTAKFSKANQVYLYTSRPKNSDLESVSDWGNGRYE